MVIFDDEYASVEINQEAGFIKIRWKKYAPSHAYRKVTTVVYESRREYGIPNLLSDNCHLPTISESDSHWTVDMSKKYVAFIKNSKVAVVVSEHSFVHLAIKSMQKEVEMSQEDVNPKSEIKYFPSVEAAENWLTA